MVRPMKRSVRTVPSISDRLSNEESRSSATAHMIRDDLSLGILPFSRRSDYIRLKVDSGDPETVRRAVACAFAREQPPLSLADALAGFVRSAAQGAVFYGAMHYELVLEGFHVSRDMSRLSRFSVPEDLRFSVDSIMPFTVFKSFGRLVQRIPAEDSATGKRRTIVLDKGRIFDVSLPDISQSLWLRMMATIVELDRSWLAAADLISKDGFVFSVQRGLIERAQLCVTNPISWVRAGVKPKEMSDVYLAYRWLKMQRVVYSLRDSIVSIMNHILDVAGNAKGFNAQVLTASLPSAADAEDAANRLASGEVGPEVVDTFMQRT